MWKKQFFKGKFPNTQHLIFHGKNCPEYTIILFNSDHNNRPGCIQTQRYLA